MKKNLNQFLDAESRFKIFSARCFHLGIKLIYFWNRFLIPIVQIKWGTENLNLEAIFNLMKLFSESNKAAYISFYLTSTS